MPARPRFSPTFGARCHHVGSRSTHALVLLMVSIIALIATPGAAQSLADVKHSEEKRPGSNLLPPGATQPPETMKADEHPISIVEALTVQIDPQSEIHPLDLSSPRGTLWSLAVTLHNYRNILMQGGRNYDNQDHLDWIQKRITQCFDMSDVAPEFQDSIASDAAVRLREVMLRVPMPSWDSIPGSTELSGTSQLKDLDWYRFTNVPIEMSKVKTGERAGQWLITQQTRDKARSAYKHVSDLPLIAGNEGLYKSHFFQTGWMVPSSLITNLPDSAGHQILGQSIWQWSLALIMSILVTALIVLPFFFLNKRLPHPVSIAGNIAKLVFQLAAGCLMIFFGDFLQYQIFLNGTILETFSITTTMIMAIAFIAAIMTIGNIFSQIIIHSPKINPNGLDAAVTRILARTVTILLSTIFAFQVLKDLGFTPTTILAGAGVTGLAFALAAQDMLKNFFASVILLIERPFKEGDVIHINDDYGFVKAIGMRSTSIRLRDGNIVYIPNAEVTQGRIENISRRPHIRSTITIGVTYSTSHDKLLRGMEILREILEEKVVSPAQYKPRVLFEEFADSSLLIQCIVWHADTSNMKCKQTLNEVNLEILRRFNDEGLQFAFPTITVDYDGKQSKTTNTANPELVPDLDEMD